MKIACRVDLGTKELPFLTLLTKIREGVFLLPEKIERCFKMSEKIEKRQTLPLVSKTEKISMKLIDPFPNHPFYVFDDNEMLELIESIRRNGLITPIIVRRKGDRYELISGHRRKRAYEYLGYAEIACSVINASDDEAIIMMVDSNCQRTKVLPSERAFAYKMKLEAMKAAPEIRLSMLKRKIR